METCHKNQRQTLKAAIKLMEKYNKIFKRELESIEDFVNILTFSF